HLGRPQRTGRQGTGRDRHPQGLPARTAHRRRARRPHRGRNRRNRRFRHEGDGQGDGRAQAEDPGPRRHGRGFEEDQGAPGKLREKGEERRKKKAPAAAILLLPSPFSLLPGTQWPASPSPSSTTSSTASTSSR